MFLFAVSPDKKQPKQVKLLKIRKMLLQSGVDIFSKVFRNISPRSTNFRVSVSKFRFQPHLHAEFQNLCLSEVIFEYSVFPKTGSSP